jgi:hypothetical protein
VLARLERLDDGMMSGMKMLGGMLVLGTVAAADMATLEAKPQMDPGVAHFEALFAAFATGFNFLDFAEVSAFSRH